MSPEGWKHVPLGEVAQIRSGGTPDRSKPSYWGGDIPWVTTGEIQFNTIVDTAEKITQAGLKNSSAKIFPPGTLLMAMYGQGKTRGQIAKLGIHAATNQNAAAILLHENQDPDFYFHYLSSRYENIREIGNSGGLTHLNAGLLRQIEVPCVPYAEQRQIAKMLAVWEQAIGATEKLLANSCKYRKALTTVLFREKRRLLGGGAWQKRKISDLIAESRIPGSTGETARKITVKLYGRGVVSKSEKRLGSDATRYYRRKAGQFIYSKLDFLNGAFGIIPAELDGYESTLDLPAFDFLDGVDPRWFLHYISREDFYLGHLGLANGGRKARRVNPNDLSRIAIEVPEITEQRVIADAIDTAIADEKTLERMVAHLKAEKRVLMEDLLTGKRRVRVSTPEKEASAA